MTQNNTNNNAAVNSTVAIQIFKNSKRKMSELVKAPYNEELANKVYNAFLMQLSSEEREEHYKTVEKLQRIALAIQESEEEEARNRERVKELLKKCAPLMKKVIKG